MTDQRPDDQQPSDADLLAEVGAAVTAHDPVPDDVLAAARASLTWLHVDAELAELVEDSLMTTSGVRSDNGRALVFESPVASIVLEVEGVGAARRLLGQIVTPRAASVQLRHPGGRVDVEADDLGRFTADAVPAGRVSLSFHFHDGGQRDLVTSWVTI